MTAVYVGFSVGASVLLVTLLVVFVALNWSRIRNGLWLALGPSLFLAGLGATGFGAAEWSKHCVTLVQPDLNSDAAFERAQVHNDVLLSNAQSRTVLPFSAAVPVTLVGLGLIACSLGVISVKNEV